MLFQCGVVCDCELCATIRRPRKSCVKPIKIRLISNRGALKSLDRNGLCANWMEEREEGPVQLAPTAAVIFLSESTLREETAGEGDGKTLFALTPG